MRLAAQNALVRFTRVLAVLLACLGASRRAWADVTYPDRPPAGQFVLDLANLTQEGDRAAIEGLASALLAEKGFPLLVVTVPSLVSYGAEGESIESYARDLFNRWGVGRPDHNYGILLLVARDDRRARIELGKAWTREHDAVCRTIMDTLIIPNFKGGDMTAGLRLGAQGLASMARGDEIPSIPLSKRARMVSRGLRSVWSSLSDVLWVAIVLPVMVVMSALRWVFQTTDDGWWSRSSSDDSGSWWGGSDSGSFGGGSSDGGGSSGSW